MSEYAGTNRDIDDIEPHYSKHVDAMTTEGLHKKSAIAAELAYRDKRIEELEARVKELERSDINVGFEPLLKVCSVSGNLDGIGFPTRIIIERVDDSEMFAVYVPSN